VIVMSKMWPRNTETKKLIALAARKEKAKTTERIDDSKLYAGSSMHYYCRLCGLLAATLPEEHSEPPPKFCDECQEMIDHGYSVEKREFTH
jgi:hypothetical protein